ncbi:MAG: hypothetical protein U7M05_10980, partial [Candidatus Igneacidithiobacillus chanchocoensis]
METGARVTPDKALRITLIAHYGIVDLTTMSDSKFRLRQLDSVRRTLVSVTRPVHVFLQNRDGRGFRAAVTVRDSMLHAPAGMQSLAALGQAVGVPKLDLPEGRSKTAMGDFFKEDLEGFLRYAARDTHVPILWLAAIYGDGGSAVPVTLGAGAMQQYIDATGLGSAYREVMCGLVKHNVSAGERRKTVWTVRDEVAPAWHAAAAAYYGGRNECLTFGVYNQAVTTDYDIVGAYPTAMCLIPDFDFEAEPSAIVGPLSTASVPSPLTPLFGRVDFDFPPDCKIPCLPVSDPEGRGLIFPLSGRGVPASGPEVWLALKLGARVTALAGSVIHPYKQDADGGYKYTMARGIKGLVQRRAEMRRLYGRGSPQELAAKESVNSVYGKLAQGLAGKRVYSTRSDETSAVPPSTITQPMQAAMTTALVRALVSAAMYQLEAKGIAVHTVTTDGCVSDATFEDLLGCDCYGLVRLFAKAGEFLRDDGTVWEIKHRQEVLCNMKTRGNVGVSEDPEAKGVLARAGVATRMSNAEG